MEVRSFEFQVDGLVTLEGLHLLVAAWWSTFRTISDVVGRNNIESSHISNLQGGSPLAVTDVTFRSAQSAARFTELFDSTVKRAGGDTFARVPPQLEEQAIKLAGAAAKAAPESGVVFRSPEADMLINPAQSEETASSSAEAFASESFGAIQGRLESLSSRQGIRAMVYDNVFGRGVRLSLDESFKDDVRELWDRPVEAVGLVRRDARSGRPLSIVDVRSIRPIPIEEDEWSWKRARGVLRQLEPGVPSEVLLQRGWDE